MELVPVGVGADDLERAVLFGGIDLHGQMIRARIKKGDVVNVDVAGRDDEEVDRCADARDQKQAAKRNGEPAALLSALFGGRARIVQRRVVLLVRLQRACDAVAIRVLERLFVDGVDEVVEHLRIRREIFLEILRHGLGIRKLDGLDLFFLREVDRLVLARDGGNDERIVELVALHVLDQRVLELLRRLIPVLWLEGAGLEDDLGNFVVRVHWDGERLARDSAAVGGLCRRVFVLKGRVVAVEDPVENEAYGIDICCRLDRAEQTEQLRRRVGAEHALGHRAVFEIVNFCDTEVAEQEMTLRV